ncbi:AIG2-like family-domain-containing protein [Lasiosphaeria miniovina]|uniref:Putative gamma-glutamylcyclotransferase n=1 Tax=Lasiosphaeria miniovina TaxID=1954250 RepID=A0AA40B5S6_9PEZI|nr:AIG2-like family-domain-containing protein [Lasiosphaeria miniovina]KAK0728187.1 AIG2-like family-domain-containing protein [Lasiosphaeria miniovina]
MGGLVAATAQSDDGLHCAFFYGGRGGTQMVPEVFYSVCYNNKDVPEAIAKLHSFHPAILHGFCRRRVEYADYPGITEDEDHQVFGSHVTGLTEANIQKLDYFEGSAYERRTVKVRLLVKVGNAKGEGNVECDEKTAQVYVYRNKRDLEDKEWDLEEFRREKLKKWTRAGYVFEGA